MGKQSRIVLVVMLVLLFAPALRAEEEAGPPDHFGQVRLRVSPPFSQVEQPSIFNEVGTSLSVSLWEHFTLEYGFAMTFHGHSDATAAHSIMLGGRLRALDLRDSQGCGFVIDTYLLGGYAFFKYEYNDGWMMNVSVLGLKANVESLWWFTEHFGMGLDLSGNVYFPVHTSGESDEYDSPYGGGGAALVFAVAF